MMVMMITIIMMITMMIVMITEINMMMIMIKMAAWRPFHHATLFKSSAIHIMIMIIVMITMMITMEINEIIRMMIDLIRHPQLNSIQPSVLIIRNFTPKKVTVKVSNAFADDQFVLK